MAYAGRLAIIAGGLGGIGTSIAQLLHAESAHIALLYAPVDSPRVPSILSSSYSTPLPATILPVECDITSEHSIAESFAQIAAHARTHSVHPCILINAAGYVSVQPLADTSAEEAMRNLLPNLLGPLLVSKAFQRLYLSHPGGGDGGGGAAGDSAASVDPAGGSSTNPTPTRPPGRIVSISSQAAHVALDGHSAYCASKAGLNALTRCMALEWGGLGITSNTVSPTVVLTELGKKAWADEEKRAGMERMIPTGRFAEPHEVAQAVVALCADGMGMVNGGDLRVDGGFTIR